MTLFTGQTVNAGHFLQPTTIAMGHRVISLFLYSAFAPQACQGGTHREPVVEDRRGDWKWRAVLTSWPTMLRASRQSTHSSTNTLTRQMTGLPMPSDYSQLRDGCKLGVLKLYSAARFSASAPPGYAFDSANRFSKRRIDSAGYAVPARAACASRQRCDGTPSHLSSRL